VLVWSVHNCYNILEQIRLRTASTAEVTLFRAVPESFRQVAQYSEKPIVLGEENLPPLLLGVAFLRQSKFRPPVHVIGFCGT